MSSKWSMLCLFFLYDFFQAILNIFKYYYFSSLCAGVVPKLFECPDVYAIAHSHSPNSIVASRGIDHILITNEIKIGILLKLLIPKIFVWTKFAKFFTFQSIYDDKLRMELRIIDGSNDVVLEAAISNQCRNELSAVLLKNHGLLVWGGTWQIAVARWVLIYITNFSIWWSIYLPVCANFYVFFFLQTWSHWKDVGGRKALITTHINAHTRTMKLTNTHTHTHTNMYICKYFFKEKKKWKIKNSIALNYIDLIWSDFYFTFTDLTIKTKRYKNKTIQNRVIKLIHL